MSHFSQQSILTDSGAMAMLDAAMAEARRLDCPQCIVIVDASGELLAEIRMTGAKFLSRKTARAKARTAASIRAPSGSIPEAVRTPIGLASGGRVTGVAGGLPIVKNGEVLGGIGVGSGSPEQDLAVAEAALVAIGADRL